MAEAENIKLGVEQSQRDRRRQTENMQVMVMEMFMLLLLMMMMMMMSLLPSHVLGLLLLVHRPTGRVWGRLPPV